MYWSSILYFFSVTLLTGTLIDLLVKGWRADWLEKLVMRIGVGLAAMSVIGVIFNLLRIPLDYRVFLAAGVLIGIGALVRNRGRVSVGSRNLSAGFWKTKSFWYGLVVLALFAVTVKMYVGGAFTYDYLEDTDPWGYTAVADYIGENRTFTAPYYSIQYSEPYTQGYQIVMGVLSQTNPSIYWTMKFFSALIVSFGVPFMYYFARRFSGNEDIALLSAVFLFAVPAWTTHFVFSLHFNMTIFVVLLYVLAQLINTFLESIGGLEGDRGGDYESREGVRTGWMGVGMLVYASMLLNHFSSVFHASVFCFVLITTRILAEKRIDWKTILLFPGGFLISLVFYIPAYANHWWLTETDQGLGGLRALFPLMRFIVSPTGGATLLIFLILLGVTYRTRRHWQPCVEEWLSTGKRGWMVWLGLLCLALIILAQPYNIVQIFGTGTAVYTIQHFFSASSANLMNNPIGLGPLLMSAVLGSFLLASALVVRLFQPANAWVAVGYSWIIAALALVLGGYTSIVIMPFRAWTFLGLFASLFAAWGVVTFVGMLSRNQWVLLGTIALLGIILVPTSFLPKYRLNTMVWKSIVSGLPEAQALFAWMREGGIPKNSVVAHLCGSSEFLSGYDMNPPVWDETFHPALGKGKPYFVAHPLRLTPEAYSVLRNAGVEYVTFGDSCYGQVPRNQRMALSPILHEAMIKSLSDGRLAPVKSTGNEFLFKLN